MHGLYTKSSALVTPKDQSAGTGVWHFDFGLTNHREFFRRWPAPSDLLFPCYRAGCISHHSSVGKAKFSQLFKLWKATLRARCCSTFHPHRIKQCRAWNCQWPLPQPQLAWAHRTPGTLMCRGNQLLQTKLRSDSLPKGVDLNPHHSREQRKPVSQPLAPNPHPTAPGALLVLETDERPCVSWPFRCGKKTRGKSPRSAFSNLMEDQGCVLLPHCHGGTQTLKLCNAWSPQRPGP